MIIILLLSICLPLRWPAIVTLDFSITSSAYCTTFCNKAQTLLTPWGRVSCISKTACFLVNCAPLSLQCGRNEEPKGSKWVSSVGLRLLNSTLKIGHAPILVHKASANQRLSHHWAHDVPT